MGSDVDNNRMRETRPRPTHYRYLIRIEGHLNANWSEWFGGMSITTELTSHGAETVIEGLVADQAALHGLLLKLNNLNLPLIKVQRLGPARSNLG